METTNKLTSDYQAIVQTLQYYIDGSLAGKSQLMQAGFHTDATIYGYYRGNLVSGSIQKLYDLIDGNGPAPDIQPQVASIEILGAIAVARLEVAHWTGKVIGSDTHMSDLFTLVKTEAGWKISHKSFHMHTH
jgi:hypothetical protein